MPADSKPVGKKNVLIFPCGSEIGLELHKSLQYSTHFHPVGGSSVPDHGEFAFGDYVGGLPFVDDPAFIERLNEVIEEHGIDFIFPAHDSVVMRLVREKAAGRLKCEVVGSPLETCAVCRSKRLSYERFQGIVPTPRIYENPEAIPASAYPVFLKPDAGQGSKGIFLAPDRSAVDFYTRRDPSLLLLEYLPGKEYTIDCFTSRKGGLIFAEGRERRRISNGISVRSQASSEVRFRELAAKINQELTFRGAWFFQVKERCSGELVLMEIAPRIAGTMGLVRCMGVNLAILSLFDAMGGEVHVSGVQRGMVIDRALQNFYRHGIRYRHVYLDFDDLVVFEGKVNPAVMAFVYQCFNRDIQVHLITRHKGDLPLTLRKYRLDRTFTDIIWIRGNEDKHEYITEPDAIFIDDSFEERRRVSLARGIPTFDAHSLESLMEPF